MQPRPEADSSSEEGQQQPAEHREQVTPAERRTQERQAAEAERAAAALARSITVHEDRSNAALGEADAARGRAAEADARGDLGTAGAEWATAYSLDGLSAEESAAALRGRAEAARTTSTTVPAGTPGRPSPKAATAGPATAPARSAAPRRTA